MKTSHLSDKEKLEAELTELEGNPGRNNGKPRDPIAAGGLLKLDVARMVDEDPPLVQWRVDGLAVDGVITMIAGREGEGKSLLAMALAAAVASGEEVAGMSTEQGRVVIVDAENGRYETHRRVHSLGLPRENVSFYTAEGFNLQRNLDALEEIIVQEDPDLLILDSFRSLWPGGDENDSGDTSAVLDPLRNLIRKHGVAVILLHHSPKSSPGYRGSSAIGGATEINFNLARESDDPEKATRRYLDCTKCRPAAEPPRRWLKLHTEFGQVFVEATEPFRDPENGFEAPAPVQAQLAPDLLAAAKAASKWPDLALAIGRNRRDGTARRIRDHLLKTGDLHELADGRLMATPTDLEGATALGGAKPRGTPIDGSSKPDLGGVPGCQPLKGDDLVAPPGQVWDFRGGEG